MEKLNDCPICKHNKQKLFIECQDHTVSRETFRVVQCEACGFRFTNPRPDEKEISKALVNEDGSFGSVEKSSFEELEKALASTENPQKATLKENMFEDLKKVFGKDIEVLVGY